MAALLMTIFPLAVKRPLAAAIILTSLLLAAAPNTARAGQWQGGYPECEGMASGCAAAQCNAFHAFGKHGLLNGFSAGACVLEHPGWMVQYYINDMAPTVQRNGHASLLCGPDETRRNGHCLPHFDQSADPCGAGGASGLVGNPIDAFTGQKRAHAIDLTVGSGPAALTLERHYSTGSAYGFGFHSALGGFWRRNFDATARYDGIFARKPWRLFIKLPDGREMAFVWTPNVQNYLPAYKNAYNYWQSTNWGMSERASLDDGVITLTTASRDVYRFDLIQTGTSYGQPVFKIRLSEIANRSGRLWRMVYDATDVLIRVEDQFGGQIEFTYDADGALIAAIGSDGVAVSYAYSHVHSSIMGAISADAPADFPDQNYLDLGLTPPGTANAAPAILGRVLSEVSIAPVGSAAAAEVTSYHYEDPAHPFHLTGVTDPSGVQAATWRYDAQGRAISSAHADVDGAPVDETLISYAAANSAGEMEHTVTDALGRLTRFTIGPVKANTTLLNRLRALSVATAPAANTPETRTGYLYQPTSGQLSGYTETLETGVILTTDYAADSRTHLNRFAAAAGAPESHEILYEWDADLRRPTRAATPGLDIGVTYDLNGQPLTLTQTDRIAPLDAANQPYAPTVRSWGFTYTPEGLPASENGPLTPAPGAPDDVITYSYNANGHLAAATDPLGHTTTIAAANSRGQPTRVISPDGAAAEFTYDFRGRLLSLTEDADGAARRTEFGYDTLGQLIEATDPDGVRLTFAYDAARRLTRITNANGGVLRFDHDAAGNVTLIEAEAAATAPALWAQTQDYDALGRLRRVTGAAGRERGWTYDALGRVAETSDGRSAAATAAYDGLNRAVSTLNRAGAADARGYDASGGLSLYSDANLLSTGFTRTGFGEIVEEDSPDRGLRQTYRDERGLPVRVVDGRGVTADFSYDARGELTAITYPFAATPDEDVTLSYAAPGAGAAAGKLTRADDATGATLLDYAADGRLQRLNRQIEGQSYGLDIAHTAADRLASITYPSGREIRYAYDAAGAISAVEMIPPGGGAPTALAANVTHAPFGPLTGYDYGVNLSHQAGYDSSWRLISQRDSGPAGDIRHTAYSYDGNDNLTALDDLLGAADQSFSYDAEDRLLTADGPYGAISYGYTPTGARDWREPLGGARQTHLHALDSNRLLAVSAPGAPQRDFEYDPGGNLTRETIGGAVIDYSYNLAGRLAAIDRNGVRVAEYVYDHLGQMAIRRLFGPSGAPLATVHILHDLQGRRLAEHDGATGAPIREYVWLNDRLLTIIDGAGDMFWAQSDWLNRPVSLTDAAGTLIWQAAWTPFGGPDALPDAAANLLTLRFPGQWLHLEIGLHHNGLRDYDPTLGRYLQPDRLGLIDGPDLYGYAHQNPLKYVDPTGEFGIVGAFLGGGGNLVAQLTRNRGDLACVNWTDVGQSAFLGAIGGVGLASSIRADTAWAGGLMRGANLNRVRNFKAANVRRRLRRANNVTGGGAGRNGPQIVHLFIPDGGWGRNVPDRIKNARWNLAVGDAARNRRAGTRTTWEHFVYNYPGLGQGRAGRPVCGRGGGCVSAVLRVPLNNHPPALLH